MNIKVNADRTAAVAQDHFWIDVKRVPPPAGVKLLLIDKRLGSACLGTYSKHHGFTHWQALPKFMEEKA